MRNFQSREVSPAFSCSVGPADGYANRCLGIENKKGTLRPGADADLVVLDRQGNVVSTWVKGRQVWGTAA
jgi:N-acetylglucosamine-6-phosphate deacetylase